MPRPQNMPRKPRKPPMWILVLMWNKAGVSEGKRIMKIMSLTTPLALGVNRVGAIGFLLS